MSRSHLKGSSLHAKEPQACENITHSKNPCVIIAHYAHVLNYHAIAHKYVCSLCTNKNSLQTEWAMIDPQGTRPTNVLHHDGISN